jgi:hypothetical protein
MALSDIVFYMLACFAVGSEPEPHQDSTPAPNRRHSVGNPYPLGFGFFCQILIQKF